MEEKTNKLFTFDNFIEGPSNKFACSAAKAIADCPFITNRTFNYNPLVIYGGTGLGKTHLLQAIKQEVNSKFPELNVSYIKAEEYAYEHITSLANKTVNEFQNKYKNEIDILLVDDFQFFENTKVIADEFLNTILSYVDRGKQVVITANRSPKDIKDISERMRSHLESGLITDIQTPEFETRCEIIRSKAQLLHFKMDEELIEYIAKRVKTHGLHLEGITKKIYAVCAFSNEEPNVGIAQSAINDIISKDI